MTGLSPLKRLRLSGIVADRSLGQNFLIDANILGVIERMASLNAADTVLEVGPGAGVLTELLVRLSGHVHAVEVDRRLAALLEQEFSGATNFSLRQVDAMKLPFGALVPPPTKFVSNLPYHVAAPLVMKSLEEAPTIQLWCLMVQKEIGDRLFAAPGLPAYGSISVIIQLFTEKKSARKVPRTVFYPQPRVRSVLVSFNRRQGAEPSLGELPLIKQVAQAAFRHRRKTLVNSLADVPAKSLPPALGRLDARGRKKLTLGLLSRMGLAAGVRPQMLSPAQFWQLARLLEDAHDGEPGLS